MKNHPLFIRYILFVLYLGLFGCGGGSGTTPPNPVTPKTLVVSQSGLDQRQTIDVEMRYGDVTESSTNNTTTQLTADQPSFTFDLRDGQNNIQVKNTQNGVTCNMPEADNITRALNVELNILCDDTAIEHITANLSLGSDINVNGTQLTLQGLVTDSIFLKSPGMQIILDENTSFNGKLGQVEIELNKLVVEQDNFPIQVVNIATKLTSSTFTEEDYLTNNKGQVQVSYDSRLFAQEDSNNIGLLIATFSCPDSSVASKTCELKQPIRALLTPEQFQQGDWHANTLTEIIYRQAQYYVLSGYNTSTMEPYINLMSQYLLKQQTSETSTVYSDLLLGSAQDYESRLKEPQLIKNISKLLKSDANQILDNQISAVFTPAIFSPLISELKTSYNYEALAIENNTAYLGSSNRLDIVDLTNLSQPVLIHSIDEIVNNKDSEIKDIVVQNQVAYIALGKAGIIIIDLTEPTNPNIISTYDENAGWKGTAFSLDINNDYIYVASGISANIFKTDTEGQIAPHAVITLKPEPGLFCKEGVSQVKAHKGKLFIGRDCGLHLLLDWITFWSFEVFSGLYMVDISDPNQIGEPRVIDKVPSIVHSITTANNRIYVGTANSFYAINTSNPNDPEVLGPYFASGVIEDISEYNNKLYLGTKTIGIEVYRVEDMKAELNNTGLPTAASIPIDADLNSLKVTEQGIFVASQSENTEMASFHIFDPNETTLNAPTDDRLDTPGFTHHVAIKDDVAYIADGLSGLKIVDIKDGRPMQILGNGILNDISEEGKTYAMDVIVDDDQLFLANGFGGTLIADISNLQTPKFLGLHPNLKVLNFKLPVGSLAIKDKVLYAGYFPGFEIIDISNPFSTTQEGSYIAKGGFFGGTQFFVDGEFGFALVNTISFKDNLLVDLLFAFLGIEDSPSLQIYDLKNPKAPSRFKPIENFPADVRGVATLGEFAYIVCGNNCLRVVNISDKDRPYIVNETNTNGFSFDIAIHQNIAYIANGDRGIAAFDISTGTAPKLLGNAAIGGIAYDLVINNDKLYVAAGNRGLVRLNTIKL